MSVISSAVKEAIAVPSLEFDREGAIDMPVYEEKRINTEVPKVQFKSDYNPFKQAPVVGKSKMDWEKLYERKTTDYDVPPVTESIFPEEENKQIVAPESFPNLLQYKGKYLITVLKSGLTMIDRRRAHIRILFDEYMKRMTNKQGLSQRLIFPEIISFTPREATVLPFVLDELAYIGFDLADLGSDSYSINGVPSGLENMDIQDTLQDMVDKVLETGCEVKEEIIESLALALAKKASISHSNILSEEEAMALLARLFSCPSPNYTPDGKLIVSILSEDELTKRFK